jgi:YVTN family beta-propeller protein
MSTRLMKSIAFLVFLGGIAAGTLAQTAPTQSFITIDYPGATETNVREINNNGVMAGRYLDSQQIIHGFVLQSGAFTAINFPGAVNTAIWGINDNGDLVGRYDNGGDTASHGFLLRNGVYTTIDPPNSTYTFALGINNAGQIVGYWYDAEGILHGFFLNAGVYSTIDFPSSTLTSVFKINNMGAMVGVYDDSSGNEHGFLLQNGTFTSIDYPDAFVTDAYGINDNGEIVGAYLATSESNPLGFDDINGHFTTVNFPAAVDGSAVEDVNNAGQLAGEYIDANGVIHGFVSATGPFAYVANINSNTVSMIDIPSSLVVNTIPVGSGPWGVAVSPNGQQVYVTNNHGGNVSVIDTATSTVVATIPVQSSPLALAFTPDGTSVYVVNEFSNSVSVIDTATQTVTATVPVGNNPEGVAMALTSKGTFAYVVNALSNTVSVIAVGSSPTIVQTINVGSTPGWVAVSPNSSLAYVENGGSNTVSVISVASNTVTATIPVGTGPFGIAFSPDSTMAYVVNGVSNTVSVIDTASSSVVATVTGFNRPVQVALSTDGSAAYVTNLFGNNVSVITTSTNTISATVGVGEAPIGIAIAAEPTTTLQITQPLSPTQPNTFNFLTNNFVVQYPPGSNFSGVNMTVAQVQISQAQYAARVSNGQFRNSTCIVYGGAGGNCVDYQVTCSTTSGNPIACPSEAQPTIAVQTSFDTLQSIVNPGFLMTPIGQNQWQNIFTGLTDPTVKGKTKGFSEFVAMDLGATNAQGPGTLTFLAPLRPSDPRVFGAGVQIPVKFQLASVIHAGQAVTDALAGLTVVWEVDATGKSQNKTVLAVQNAFHFQTGTGYTYQLNSTGFAPGTYLLTVYGNAFSAQHVQFSVVQRIATTCVLNSSTSFFSNGQPLTFTLLVQPGSTSSNSPTGQATFVDTAYSQYVLGTAAVTRGSGSINAVLAAPPNLQWTKASYSGDNNFAPCTSSYIAENYNPPRD